MGDFWRMAGFKKTKKISFFLVSFFIYLFVLVYPMYILPVDFFSFFDYLKFIGYGIIGLFVFVVRKDSLMKEYAYSSFWKMLKYSLIIAPLWIIIYFFGLDVPLLFFLEIENFPFWFAFIQIFIIVYWENELLIYLTEKYGWINSCSFFALLHGFMWGSVFLFNFIFAFIFFAIIIYFWITFTRNKKDKTVPFLIHLWSNLLRLFL